MIYEKTYISIIKRSIFIIFAKIKHFKREGKIKDTAPILWKHFKNVIERTVSTS